MSATQDALSVFKDGRRANSLWPTLVLQTEGFAVVYSTREKSRLHVDAKFALYVPKVLL